MRASVARKPRAPATTPKLLSLKRHPETPAPTARARCWSRVERPRRSTGPAPSDDPRRVPAQTRPCTSTPQRMPSCPAIDRRAGRGRRGLGGGRRDRQAAGAGRRLFRVRRSAAPQTLRIASPSAWSFDPGRAYRPAEQDAEGAIGDRLCRPGRRRGDRRPEGRRLACRCMARPAVWGWPPSTLAPEHRCWAGQGHERRLGLGRQARGPFGAGRIRAPTPWSMSPAAIPRAGDGQGNHRRAATATRAATIYRLSTLVRRGRVRRERALPIACRWAWSFGSSASLSGAGIADHDLGQRCRSIKGFSVVGVRAGEYGPPLFDAGKGSGGLYRRRCWNLRPTRAASAYDA